MFREWAPNASAIYLTGDFNNWSKTDEYKLNKLPAGVWEIHLPLSSIQHGQLYKMHVVWPGGSGERIPAYANYVLQDQHTHLFSAQVWEPEKPYSFKNKRFKPESGPLFIYECHIGMAQEEERVGTYNEFREKILPRIAKTGYNTLQIMAIQEHPYYGSFGYQYQTFAPLPASAHPTVETVG